MERNDRINKKTTSFMYLLKVTSLRPLVLSPAFFIALISAIITFYGFIHINDYDALIDYVSDTIASISASLLGIVIAGLAILITITQGKLLGLFLQKNILQKFLFPFWIMSGFWALSTFICILFKLLSFVSEELLHYLFTLESFIFMYALVSTVSLMGHSIRLGLYVASIEKDD